MITGIAVLLIGKVWRASDTVNWSSLNISPTMRQSALIAIMALWTLLMTTLGFGLSSLLAFVAIMLIANFDKIETCSMSKHLTASFVIVVMFYLLMRDVLLLRLPTGLWF